MNDYIKSTKITSDSEIENSLRPTTLDEYVGQDKVKDSLNIFIQAAKTRGEPLDHVLLYGPPGLGKTTLSHIIAGEMGSQLKVTSGPAIEHAADLAAILTNLQKNEKHDSGMQLIKRGIRNRVRGVSGGMSGGELGGESGKHPPRQIAYQ